MMTITSIAYWTDVIALALMLSSAIVSVFRNRDVRRFDVAMFAVLLWSVKGLPNAEPWQDSIRNALLAAFAVGLLRLAGHFRAITGSLVLAAALPAVGFLVVGPLVPPDARVGLRLVVAAYVCVVFAVGSLFFARQASPTSGPRRRRLGFAAAGCAAIACSNGYAFLAAAADLYAGVEITWPVVPTRVLDAAATVCFYLAFATPRFLITRWRRLEHFGYLTRQEEREPEERGFLAANDLTAAVQKGIGGSVSLFASRRATDNVWVVHSSSDALLTGRELPTSEPLLDAVAGGTLLLGTARTNSELGALLRPHGSILLAAPVRGATHFWGVAIAVHRHGALFPEDDLEMLQQIARSSATALDHAALIEERRDQARREADLRLRQVESRVELMLDSITDYAMLVLDETGAVVGWHHGAEHLFGFAPGQMSGGSAAQLFDLPSDDFEIWLAEARTRGGAERDLRCLRADGRTFIGTTMIRPLVAGHGIPPGFVLVAHDVTDRRHLEERLRQGQKMQAIGQLAGGVAHDFNNLLAAISGYVEWLERDLEGDPLLPMVSGIRRAADRGAQLTRQLLAFSRRQVVQPHPMDIAGLIDGVLPMLRRLIHHDIEIVSTDVRPVSAVLGDRNQFEQILLNLVINARDAMPHGGRIAIRTTDQIAGHDAPPGGLAGAHVVLEVSDTGVGMDAETCSRAFEPFFTTKDVGQGTGLGLAIVYGAVQQMGGTVQIESQVNQGTTVRVRLPRAAHLAKAVEGPIAAVARETVLLVEPEREHRLYVAESLEYHGYRVIAAESAAAALSLTDTFAGPIALVITSLLMPDATGPALVGELARNRPGLSALFVAGSAEAQAGQLAAPVGALLRRPFSSAELVTRVRQILVA